MSVLNFVTAFLVLFLVWSLMVRRGTKQLTCTRTFSVGKVFEGEEGELIEVVRNDRPCIIPWLRVESKISPYLQLGKQENLHISGEMYYCSCFTLMPYQQIRRRHRVSFTRRGVYNLGNATMTTGDIFGISRYWKEQKLDTPVMVFPRLLDQEDLPYPVSQMLGDLIRRSQLLKDPFLIRGIRAYQPGDPIRDIHWAATAKTGEVQVRVHDSSSRTRLMVVLNAQYDDNQWSDIIQEKDAGPVEAGIRLAASLCVHTLRAGLSAGFAANMPQEMNTKSTIVMPADGTVQEEELLTAFARLRVHCAEKFLSILDSLTGNSGLDILVISAYDSQDIRTRMEKLKQAGNQVSFYLLEGGSL